MCQLAATDERPAAGWSKVRPSHPAPAAAAAARCLVRPKKRGKNRSLWPWPRRYVTSVYTHLTPVQPRWPYTPCPDRSCTTKSSPHWHFKLQIVYSWSSYSPPGIFVPPCGEKQAADVKCWHENLNWFWGRPCGWRGSQTTKPLKPNCAPHLIHHSPIVILFPSQFHVVTLPCHSFGLWMTSIDTEFRCLMTDRPI